MLEHIGKVFPTENEYGGPKTSANGGGSSKKSMVSFSDWIPKKSCKEAKYSALCKKHGGMKNTHNTGDCHKYERDGTPKKAFEGKSLQCNLCNRNAPHEHNTSYAQLFAKIVMLEKSNKKLNHASRKHKCCENIQVL